MDTWLVEIPPEERIRCGLKNLPVIFNCETPSFLPICVSTIDFSEKRGDLFLYSAQKIS